MSVETDLVAHLQTYAGLAALVLTRVYPDVRAQNALLPHVVCLRVTTPRWQALGASSPILASNPLFQFTIWSTSAANREAVATQLRLGLTDFAENHAACAIFEDERNSIDPETKLWRRDIDTRILHIGA